MLLCTLLFTSFVQFSYFYLLKDLPEDLALEEGKREIITREIVNFREHMKVIL